MFSGESIFAILKFSSYNRNKGGRKMLIFPLVNDTSRKIIHIDIDPSTISKRVKVDIPIVGDVKEVIADMLNLLETTDKRPDPEKLAAWQNRINGWREKDCLHYENSASVIKPQYVLQKPPEVSQWRGLRNLRN